MLKQVVSLVLLGVALASAANLRPVDDREDYPDIDYFTCTPTSPELNDHPTDCTRFIHCDNGRAHDKTCAFCGTLPECKDSRYLHFQRNINATACIWPSDSPCKSDPITTPSTPITTTTEGSTRPCQANCTVEENDCRSYRFCNRTSNNPDNDDGVWVVVECEDGFFFNEKVSDRVGACTIWDELDDDVQLRYNQQGKCRICTITPNPATSDCTEEYIVTEKDGTSKVKKCKSPRLFEKKRNGCVHTCVPSS